jgi:hypothetical protein
VPEAAAFLGQIEQLEVEPREQAREAVGVAYDLHKHSLEELEGSLEDQGYHLDNTLMSKMVRALIYYVEETQLHNLETPSGRSNAHSRSLHPRLGAPPARRPRRHATGVARVQVAPHSVIPGKRSICRKRPAR